MMFRYLVPSAYSVLFCSDGCTCLSKSLGCVTRDAKVDGMRAAGSKRLHQINRPFGKLGEP